MARLCEWQATGSAVAIGETAMTRTGPFRWESCSSRGRLLIVAAVTSSLLPGQTLMPGGMFRLFSSDAAILESNEARKDLPCTVTPVKPALGFDLRFHAGYAVSIPLRELAGEGNQLTMIFRITPESQPDEPVLLSQRMSVPNIEEDAKGDATLQGAFDVGEGKYHIDWMMRD